MLGEKHIPFKIAGGGYDGLMVTVCKLAVEDYRKAKKALQKLTDPTVPGYTEEVEKHSSTMKDVLRFFRSDWGMMLSFGYGQFIAKKLESGEI